MTNIIQFDPGMARPAPRGGASEIPAKILFFTGVRYERRPEQGDAASRVHKMGLAGSKPRGRMGKAGIKRAPDYHDEPSPFGRGQRR